MFDVTRSLMLTFSLLGVVSVLTAQGAKPAVKPTPTATKPGDAKAAAPKDTYDVVEVAHHLKAMTATSAAALTKEKHAAFETAMAEFEKARAAAEASKQKFDRKPPTEEMVETKKTGLASMADAEKFIDDAKKAEKEKADKEKAAKEKAKAKAPAAAGKK